MDQRHYTIYEDLYLAIGVLKHGSGSWSEIRDDPSIPIFRSNVSMKDHWRFLCNKGKFYCKHSYFIIVEMKLSYFSHQISIFIQNLTILLNSNVL